MSNIIAMTLLSGLPEECVLNPVRRSGDSVTLTNYDGTSEFYTQAIITSSSANAKGQYVPKVSLTEPVIRSIDGVDTNVAVESISADFRLSRKATEAERKRLRDRFIALLDGALTVDVTDSAKGLY